MALDSTRPREAAPGACPTGAAPRDDDPFGLAYPPEGDAVPTEEHALWALAPSLVVLAGLVLNARVLGLGP
jgi:hypothetical protein